MFDLNYEISHFSSLNHKTNGQITSTEDQNLRFKKKQHKNISE